MTIHPSTRHLLIAGIQAATLTSALSPAIAAPTATDVAQTDTQTSLNQVSLKSIEESWLKVPRVCKAAAFNAEPVALSAEARSAAVAQLHAAFSA